MQSKDGLSTGTSALIGVACFIIIVAGMRSAGDILVPFFLSVFIAIIFTPPLFWMQKKGVPSVVAIVFIITCLVAIFYLIARFVGTSVNDFTNALPEFYDLYSSFGPALGSNSWVLGPSRTKSGNAILANDPHIGFTNPSIWYEAHLKYERFESYGFHLPRVSEAGGGTRRGRSAEVFRIPCRCKLLQRGLRPGSVARRGHHPGGRRLEEGAPGYA